MQSTGVIKVCCWKVSVLKIMQYCETPFTYLEGDDVPVESSHFRHVHRVHDVVKDEGVDVVVPGNMWGLHNWVLSQILWRSYHSTWSSGKKTLDLPHTSPLRSLVRRSVIICYRAGFYTCILLSEHLLFSTRLLTIWEPQISSSLLSWGYFWKLRAGFEN